MVGEAVQQGSGEPLGAEHVGPLVKGEVGGDQDGAPFVALAEDLEEEFRPGGGQGHKASSSMISSLRRDSCRWRLTSRLSSPGPSGPLYLAFTGATSQRGSPAWFPSVVPQRGTPAR